MPKLPVLNGENATREMIDVFSGYNHNLKIQDGELYFTKDLTVQYYPLLANRPRRGIWSPTAPAYDDTAKYIKGTFCTHDGKLYRCTTAIDTAEAWTAAHWEEAGSMLEYLQGIIAKDKLYYVAKGYLYAEDSAVPLLDGLDYSGPIPGGATQWQQKQLISMGSYIVIFPNKKYYNTKDDTDKGSLDAYWSDNLSESGGLLSFNICSPEGGSYSGITADPTAPANPSDGDYWLDTTDTDDCILKQYSSDYQSWMIVPDVCTSIIFGGNPGTSDVLGSMFKAGDFVHFDGFGFGKIDGDHEIVKVNGFSTFDCLVLKGALYNGGIKTKSSGSVSISRKSPYFDYVIEAQNRLWGCIYGKEFLLSGEFVNEIHCSALGDFRNWNKYEGLSTDSWTASCGTDGQWTGAVNYLGKPCFFKENRIYTVTISAIGAHRLDEIVARGVQPGSRKSLQVVNETLYYKSRTGVMAWQGGMPADVSAALGDEKYGEAAAGVFGQRYYISMKDAGGEWNLFCYDAGKGLWMREDDLHALQFAQLGDELYAMVKDGNVAGLGNAIYALNGTVGTLEPVPRWIAETGIQHYQTPDKKYVSRYNIRLSMEAGSKVQMYLQYNSKTPWEFMGEVRAGDVSTDNTGTANVPVRPRRCDHLRLRLEGTGNVKILSITRMLRRGSDI